MFQDVDGPLDGDGWAVGRSAGGTLAARVC